MNLHTDNNHQCNLLFLKRRISRTAACISFIRFIDSICNGVNVNDCSFIIQFIYYKVLSFKILDFKKSLNSTIGKSYSLSVILSVITFNFIMSKLSFNDS